MTARLLARLVPGSELANGARIMAAMLSLLLDIGSQERMLEAGYEINEFADVEFRRLYREACTTLSSDSVLSAQQSCNRISTSLDI